MYASNKVVCIYVDFDALLCKTVLFGCFYSQKLFMYFF